jgi:LPS sulfotransferase NodH
MYALHLRNSEFSLGNIDERNNDPEGFLSSVWKNKMGHRIIGFKFTNRDNEEIYWKVVKDPSILKIILRRNNRIKTYVSTLMSEATGQWEVYDDTQISKQRPKVFVDPEGLFHAIKRYSDYYIKLTDVLDKTGQFAYEVRYEDLFSEETRQALLKYLGVGQTSSTLKVESVKQNPLDLKLTISNYDELVDRLQSSLLHSELISKSL